MGCALHKREQKYFIGLELRTSNEECSLPMPAHKEKFFSENTLAKIPNKISGEVLALYTDYEGDYTKPYSWIWDAKYLLWTKRRRVSSEK